MLKVITQKISGKSQEGIIKVIVPYKKIIKVP